MKRRVVLLATVLGLLIGTLLITARPTHAIPDFWHVYVQGVKQKQQAWCWAASLRSIMGYHGTWVTQCQIVIDGWGMGCWWWQYGWPDVRATRVLDKYGFGHTLTGPISFNSIRNELYYGNRPIYVRVMYGVASGHAFVLSGYDATSPNYVERMEPGDGSFRVCTYDWLRYGGPCPDWGDNGHSWDATIRNIYK